MRDPLDDPYQRWLSIANHEAGHACGHHRFGQAIVEIDIDRPNYGRSVTWSPPNPKT